MTPDTLAVIQWAKNTSTSNDVVKLFWDKLCDAVNQKPNTDANTAYSELRLYGGCTVVDWFRKNPISYHEVSKDVANKLAPTFENSPYGYETIEDCERYILEKMEITESEIDEICTSMNSESKFVSGKDFAGKGVAVAIASALAIQIARMIVTRIAASIAGGVIGGVLAVAAISGPAYRCTIPGVIYVSLLRQMYLASNKGL